MCPRRTGLTTSGSPAHAVPEAEYREGGTRLTEKMKSKMLHFRLSYAEYVGFKVAIEQLGLTQSEALRRFARAVSSSGPTYDGEVRDAIREYARQLKAIGVNINQIARILNSGRTPDYPTLQAGIGRLTKELVEQAEDYNSLCANARKRAQRQIGVDHD